LYTQCMPIHTCNYLLDADIIVSGGANSGDAWKRTGYCGLATAIRGLGLSTSDLELDYVVSSVQSNISTWLHLSGHTLIETLLTLLRLHQ